MKKVILCIIIIIANCLHNINANESISPFSIPNGEWNIIGEGEYYEDVFTMIHWVKGAHWTVEVEESVAQPGWYRFIAYGDACPSTITSKVFGQPDNESYMYINATDPEKAYVAISTFGNKYQIGSYVQENGFDANKYLTFENGIFSAPDSGIAYRDLDKEENWLLGNFFQNFKLSIQLNYRILDENAKTVAIADNTNLSGDIIIPAEININGETYTVTEISDSAFKNSSITSVTMSSTLEKIDGYAFKDCKKLNSVTIGENVQSLGSGCFSGCSSLSSITIPESVISIGQSCFEECSALTAIAIPKDVTVLETQCFYRCSSLASVTIPEAVTSLGNYCFGECFALTSITIPESVNSLGNSCFCDCSALYSITLPTALISMGDNCFYGCSSLAAVNIPKGISSLGQLCFYCCSSLSTITIPESINTIGANCFGDCTSLGEIISLNQTPCQVESGNLDSEMASKTLKVPADAISTYQNADFWKDFGKIEAYDPSIIEYNGLRYRILDENAKTVAVAENPDADGDITILEQVPLKDNTYIVKQLDDKAFNFTTIKSITIPQSVNSIGKFCFQGCRSLTTVTIPYGVTAIKERCFNGCDALKSIVLPESVTYLGGHSFSSCAALTELTIPESVTTIDNNCFRGSGLVSVVIPKNITQLSDYCFAYCDHLKSITLPVGITSIGEHCFSSCIALQEIIVPDGVTSIGDSCFYRCDALTSIILPKSLKTIGIWCFALCGNLKSINIPEGITNLGEYTFHFCSALPSLTLPESITTLDHDCFNGCSQLVSINIPDAVTYIGDRCFTGCHALYSISIPQGVKSLGNSCFSECKSLNSVLLPDGLTSIGEDCFYQCLSLPTITLPANVTSISENCFWDCSSLTTVLSLNTTPPQVKVGHSDSQMATKTLQVPEESITAYQTADFWKEFGTIKGLNSVEQPIISYNGRYATITAEDGCEIYYSINGAEYQLYSESVDVKGTVSVSAYARKGDNYISETATFQVTSYGSDLYAEIGEGGSLDEAYQWADEATRNSILANPNFLAFAANSGVAAGLAGKVSNIVINDKANKITLSDAGGWHSPREFEARSVSFSRSFSKQTAIDGGCAGWETIALPFDVQTVTYANGSLYPFAASSDANAHRFWLYKPDSYEWQAAAEIEANVPYLIAMPNNLAYYEAFNITGEVTFSADNVVIPATPTDLSYDYRDGYRITANYTPAAADSKRLVVNDKAVDGHEPGSCFVADERAVRPFEAYLTAPGQNRVPIFSTTSLTDGLMAEMALRVWSDTPQTVSIFAPCDARIKVYDIAGRAVRSVKVDGGKTVRIADLPAGIYIIARTKIAIIR